MQRLAQVCVCGLNAAVGGRAVPHSLGQVPALQQAGQRACRLRAAVHACMAACGLQASQSSLCTYLFAPANVQDGDGVFTRYLPAELLKEVRGLAVY